MFESNGSPKIKPLPQNALSPNVLRPSTHHNIASPKIPSGKRPAGKASDRYSIISQLDDDERWQERTSVITKQDHEDNLNNANQILYKLLDSLPLENHSSIPNSTYSLNMNEVDENTNPFTTKSQIPNSPPCVPSCIGEGDTCTTTAETSAINNRKEAKGDSPNVLKEVPSQSKTDGGAKTNELGQKPLEVEYEICEPKSSSYSLDFDLLENSDPFTSKSQIMNSPVAPAQNPGQSVNNSALESRDDPVKDADPAEPGAASQTVVAPGLEVHHGSCRDTDFTINLDEIDETADPFKPSKEVANSPVTVEARASYTINLDEIDETTDPFKPKKQMCNSPVGVSEHTATNEKGSDSLSKHVTSPLKVASVDEMDIASDPFQTKAMVANSPVQSLKQIVTEEVTDPLKTKSMVANSPIAKEVDDPFKTKSMVANSPIGREVDDPFTTKSMVANSPVAKEKDDPFKTKSMVANSPFAGEVDDPFKTKSMVANSPIAKEVDDPFKTKSMVANSPIAMEVDDPFTTKSMVANSPVGKETDDPFKTKSMVANSPFAKEVNDPFKTKSMVANSPVAAEVDDPFKTKSMVANSPVTKETDDPFKTKSVVANSPATDSIADPFQSRSYVVNSPTTSPKKILFGEQGDAESGKGEAKPDPSKEKNVHADSHKKSPKQSPRKPSGSPKKASSDTQADPFKPRNQIVNSPTKKTISSPGTCSPQKRAGTPPRWNSANSISKTPNKTASPPPSHAACSPQSTRSPGKVSPTARKPASLSRSPSRSPVKSPSQSPTWKKPTSPAKAKPASPAKAKPASPAKAKPASPAKAKPASPAKAKPTSPAKAKPTSPAKEKPTSPSIRGRKKVSPEKLSSPPSSLDKFLQEDGEMHMFGNTSLNQTVVDTKAEDGLRLPSPMAASSLGQGSRGRPLANIYEEALSEETFMPAQDVFECPSFGDPSVWDMLEKVGSGQSESNLDRLSLYVKFDPLVKARLGRQSMKLPPDPKRKSHMLPVPGTLVGDSDSEDLLGSPSKQMLTRSRNRESEEGLEQMRVLDKIFTCSPNPEESRSQPLVTRASEELVEVLQYSTQDLKEVEMKCRSEILMKEKEWHAKHQSLEEEWKARVAAEEDKCRAVVEEWKARVAAEEDKRRAVEAELKLAQDNAVQSERTNQDLRLVMADYEKTILEIQGQKEQANLDKEKSVEELATVERMCFDLHSKYEKLKTMIDSYRKNEETYKNTVTKQNAKLAKAGQAFNALKEKAEKKLNEANEEIEKTQRESQAEISKLEIELKKKAWRVENLEQSLQQKVKENEELTQICDELIVKAGS